MAVATDGRESRARRAGERDVEIVLSRSPLNLANLITLARLLMVAPLVWLIVNENLLAAFWLFIVAGVSDAADGFIAKRFNARTSLGSYLDPLADKVLLDGIYVALAMGQWLPVWLVALVIGRDLLIVFGAALIRRRNAVFRPEPLLIGKLNTFAQMLLAACALADVGGLADLTLAVDGLVIAVALTTLLSGAGYAGQALRSVRLEQTS
jgi:cardiolipin synthase